MQESFKEINKFNKEFQRGIVVCIGRNNAQSGENFIQIVQLISPCLLCIVTFWKKRGYTSTWSITVFGEAEPCCSLDEDWPSTRTDLRWLQGLKFNSDIMWRIVQRPCLADQWQNHQASAVRMVK